MEQSQSKEEILKFLEEMGFPKEKAERAYNTSSVKSLEAIILLLETMQDGENANVQSQPDPQNNPQPNQKPEEEKKDEKPFEQETQPISTMVNQQFSTELQGMGYSKNVSEKSLFLTQNGSIEKAIDWINENKASPDFEEELRIVGQQDGPKLSKEEAAQKAKELQQKIRERRLAREKEEELERERSRIKGGKAMTEARRELEELQLKRDMEAKMRQKREDELAKQKILEQLERDKLERLERLGKKPPPQGAVMQNKPQEQKPKTYIDMVDAYVKQIKIAFPSNLFPGAWSAALKTIVIYLENIVKNPVEEKFRKINLKNENFQKKVGNLIGGIEILKEAGFEEEDGFLIMKNPNVERIKSVVQFISKAL